ncbi:MAG: bifunctional methylenetetrahydrofolate dehydrogenase/methenyltetrahydrofolate cyclohydrolase FolD [Myxococcota bacterium]
MAVILDGKEVSKRVREGLKAEIDGVSAKVGRPPSIAVILVGNNPASMVYVRNKHKACAKAGINSIKLELPKETSEKELLEKIDELNHDSTVDAILVQLPLPKQIDSWKILEAVSPEKDADGFHPLNVGRLSIGLPATKSCTPAGIIKLLDEYKISIEGKEAVIIGRSNIVGKPLIQLLLARNATVTTCHSRTWDLPGVCRRADILIAATGKPKMVTKEFVKEGAVVVDVGISTLSDGSLSGDVNFDEVEPIASAITPVPGGIGPMTIAMLLFNTVELYLRKFER